MSKLVLIDGNAILHRAYHALPPLTTRAKEPINAVYGLVSMLLRVITDLKPTHLAVCFDRKEPTFRHKSFPKYQAQRPETDKELSGQFEKAKDVISAMNIPVYEKAGFEADDLLGSIAEQSVRVEEQESKSKKTPALPLSRSSTLIDEVVIVTGDRDILQLVNDKKKIRVYLPIKGLSDAKLMKSKDVIEKLGVSPEQIPDYKALVGDPSDNYPGVYGIGPKTAESLLSRYKNKDEIYKNLEDIEERVREKLERERESADLSFNLATIVKNVPIKADIAKMNLWQVDDPKVLSLFSEFGFRTLAKRVKEVGKSIVAENQTSLF